jgi:hypothetical protein
MPKLFVASRSDRSSRTAVIAEEVDSIWLYLSAPGKQGPERDCWLLNTEDAPARLAADDYRRFGSPPPLPADRSSGTPPAGARSEERWSFVWAPDASPDTSAMARRPGRCAGMRSCTRTRSAMSRDDPGLRGRQYEHVQWACPPSRTQLLQLNPRGVRNVLSDHIVTGWPECQRVAHTGGRARSSFGNGF